MIYEIPLTIAKLDDATHVLDRRLVTESRHLCAELDVYSRTYWESRQAGQTVEKMVELPKTCDIQGNRYAVLRGKVYKVERAQETEADGGLPVYRLTLTKSEDRYAVFEPDYGA